jgi:site-specific DNA recombinase
MKDKFKAALYARVSSERQIYNFSISAQIDLMQEYCTKNDIEIYDIYIDEAEKGSKENRPQLQRMLKDSNNFDIVLVHKFDRFARKEELSISLESKLQKNKVVVISVTEPIENSPMGKFQKGLYRLLSELFVNNLSTEVKKGKNKRAKMGLWNTTAPFGYNLIDKKLVINDREAKIVKYIYDRYLIHGDSLNKITRNLNKKGMKTKKNCDFAVTTVDRVLRNVLYTGKMIYNNEILQGIHESIVTEKEYGAVLEILRNNNTCPSAGKKGYRSVNYMFFWLLDIVKCGCCGRNFTIRYSGGTYHYYTCSLAYKFKNKDNKLCINSKYHKSKQFERNIIKLLERFIKGDDIEFSIPSLKRKEINISESRLKEVKKELQRLKEGYLSGLFSISEYGKDKRRLEYEKNELEHEINAPVELIQSNIYKNKLRNVWKLLISENDIAKKRALLQSIISAIYVDNEGRVKIDFA